VPSATTSVPPAAPVELGRAAIAGIGHDARGTAALYRQPDGSHVVGLLDIDIENGPDYVVYVVPGADREGPDGGTNLADLRGNQGTQYYPVPGDVALSGDVTVLVWCETFAVPVANATFMV
jgi:hypothetical protein